ncbi:MAG: hypothetical protein ACRC0X_02565, partial [Brevinema sp.]
CFRQSLEQMRAWCVENNIKKVSVPRLGCGLDKLDYIKVLKIIADVFAKTDITITIYTLPK